MMKLNLYLGVTETPPEGSALRTVRRQITSRKWWEENRDKHRKLVGGWYKNNREKHLLNTKKRRMERNFGLSYEDYQKLWR